MQNYLELELVLFFFEEEKDAIICNENCYNLLFSSFKKKKYNIIYIVFFLFEK
jgi:hypothetical protein